MGIFTSYRPSKNLYKNRETSGLASMRERSSVLKDWQSLRSGEFRSDKSTQLLQQVMFELSRIQQRSQSHYGMHPFKIYQFPDALRRYKVSDGWRRFKVRDAIVNISGSSLASPVYGSDEITVGDPFDSIFADSFGLFNTTQIPPNSTAQTSSNGAFSTWNEITLPADAQTYNFWYSFILPVAGGSWGTISTNTQASGIAVCPSGDPTQAKVMFTLESFDATTMWPTMPFDDPYNFFIGSVTVDDGSIAAVFPGTPRVTIAQSRGENLYLMGHPYGTEYSSNGITTRVRGTYDNSAKYFVGDVVTITYADASTISSFYQYVYDPPSASSYRPDKIPGALSGVSPNGNSPDPWRLLSKSPSAADYHTGAYDSSKYYLRT